MSGIAQAGFIFLVIFVLGILGRREGRAGAPIHNEDEETCWYALRPGWRTGNENHRREHREGRGR